ncbi:DUF7940 domain-containing protein [Rhizobium miluonense]|uniref:Uncharacterized protein n=1 Tax=Rhizobium miluonense TaxID=411945 RepID=A0A1C3X9Z1_9HYPH|nr:hypothetical protein [Rhizobium miluonense]SCB49058.1 hypothetical protein GA0061102_10712 [Rhizobium miluonense]
MKPKLVPRPGRALWRAYSLWPVYVAALLGLAPQIVPYLDDYVPHWLSVAILCLSPIGRIIDQGGIDAD